MHSKSSPAQVAIVTCMDPRLSLARALTRPAEEYFLLRNAGGRVTDDVIRGLILCTRLMGVTEVGVIHHTDCRLQQENEELVRMTEIDRDYRAFSELEPSVAEDILLLDACPDLSPQLRIWGGLYSVEDHTVRLLSPSQARSAIKMAQIVQQHAAEITAGKAAAALEAAEPHPADVS